MKAIKIAVVIMSILLVVGFGVVIYTISTRVSDGNLTKKSDDGLLFERATIDISPGCHLADTQLQGERVLLRFDGALERGCQKVELYSSVSGERIGGWVVKGLEDDLE